MNKNELEIKQDRLAEFCERRGLDGVLLQTRANFAWITGGHDNHILNSSPIGVASILATKDGKRVCFTSSIEAPRFLNEELVGTGIEIVSHDWFEAQPKSAGRIAADIEPDFPEDFKQLRLTLTDEELARYRDGGRRTNGAIERACRQIKPGMTEHEIAGILDHEVHAAACNPVVNLVAVDDRIEKFRHPIPTDAKVKRCAMLVTCAEFGGLISNITRLVHFGPISSDLQRRHQACCNVDAAAHLATKPGRSLGEIFAIIQRAYAENGLADEWKLHHQGGPTGYASREMLATPGSSATIFDRQAFAWNPSITGTKSEDTIFVTQGGIEVLTAKSGDWPTVMGRWEDKLIERPGILSV